MAYATTDDGVRLYYEETGSRHAGDLRARIRRRLPQLGAADAAFRPALSRDHLQCARLSAVGRAGGRREAIRRPAPRTTSRPCSII